MEYPILSWSFTWPSPPIPPSPLPRPPQVNSLHNALTQWTVEFLLYLTRVAEDEEFELVLGGMGERQTQTGLRSTSQHIIDRLKQVTAKLVQ